MRGIAANVLRNDLRRRRRSPKFQQPAEGQMGETGQSAPPADDRQREEQVAAALDALAEREEAVLRAKYLEGMSVAEIAAARGETPKAVESLLSRARQAFREVYRGKRSPCPLAGEGTTVTPLARLRERERHNSPRPLAGEGPGVRAEYERIDDPFDDPLAAAFDAGGEQPAADDGLRGAVLAQTIGVLRFRRRAETLRPGRQPVGLLSGRRHDDGHFAGRPSSNIGGRRADDDRRVAAAAPRSRHAAANPDKTSGRREEAQRF